MSTLLGNYVSAGAGADAAGTRGGSPARLTPSSRTSTSSATSVPTTSWSSAPTTSTAWTRVQMLEHHIATGAGVTVAGIRVPVEDASQFGVIQPGEGTTHRVVPGEAGPARSASPMRRTRSSPRWATTSSRPRSCSTRSTRTPSNVTSHHDMGGDVIPMLVRAGKAHVYDFADNRIPGATDRDRGYWRDVGTLDSYYDATWTWSRSIPCSTSTTASGRSTPPARCCRRPSSCSTSPAALGHALDSIVGAGVIVAGGTVRRSVISPGVQSSRGRWSRTR